MSWISLAIALITNLPAIIGVIKEIVSLVQKIRDRRLAKTEVKELSVNLRNARKFRRFEGLERQLVRLRRDYDK